jgi:surface antigen
MNTTIKSATTLLFMSGLFLFVGCATKAQTGALVGGAGGAAVGAGIGSLSHSSAGVGALIGAGVGTVGGYIVGNEMDKKDQKDRERAQNSAPSPSAQTIKAGDVIQWTHDGVKDDVIIDRIQRSGTVFRVTAGQETKLRDAGVSEDVIRAMKKTGR